MNKKILLSILSLAIILPTITFAATIEGMVDGAVRATFYIASGVVVILWLVTGMLFLTAQGDPSKLSTAKKALFAAVAGTIICIVAGGAINFVGGIFNI
jgi:heme/copper-type cytochrome/quinol oxidase subunit 4